MWVARYQDGALGFYEIKPIRGKNEWEYTTGGLTMAPIDEYLFPDLKWEDEPIEVRLVIYTGLR